MTPSPTGSKILSGYAVLFAGLVPAVLAVVAIARGSRPFLLYSIVVSPAIVYFGARVFRGDPTVIKKLVGLVMLHYVGHTATYALHYGSFSPAVAFLQVVKGLAFAGIFCWYYLFRTKTWTGFDFKDVQSTEIDLPLRSREFLGWALISAVAGGVAFAIGITAAFGRAGNWSNYLSELGILLLIIAGVTTFVSLLKGIQEAVTKRRFIWVVPVALVATGFAIWCGWIAINL